MEGGMGGRLLLPGWLEGGGGACLLLPGWLEGGVAPCLLLPGLLEGGVGRGGEGGGPFLFLDAKRTMGRGEGRGAG